MAGGDGGLPRGKTVALRALHARGEDEDRDAYAHPLVAELREEGESLLTAWRMSYDLPPNDPRYTEITEAEIIRDMLVRRFHNEHMHRLLHPAEAEIQRLAASPTRAGEALDRVKRATMANPAFQRALHALGLGGKTTVKPVTNRKITISSSTSNRGPTKP